jgi:putative ABC transport system permease protein
VTGLLHDLRHGARLLFRAPSFAAAAVLTLALAIGANTVIFSVVNLLVIQPLPLGEPDRLGWVFFTNPQNAMDRWPASLPEYAAFKADAPAFESLAGVRERTATLSRQRAPAERVVANVVVGNLFGVWRIRMYQGRGLSAADEDPAAPGVVVLSHRYWSGRFGGEPLLDQSLSIDGRPHTVVGIVSPELELGDQAEIDVWIPFQGDAESQSRADRSWSLVGRLRAEAALPGAHAQITAAAERLEREHPETNRNWRARVANTREAIAGPNTWLAIGLLFTTVALLLLLACANVMNMLLARLSARRQELAVRVALGATRLRIARQLITEALLLGAAGAALGLLLGWGGLRTMKAVAYEAIFEQFVVDTNVVLFAVALALLTPILFSTLPAVGALGGDLRNALMEGGVRSIGGRAGRQRAVLVVAQITLAVTLLGGASFVMRSMAAVMRVDPGFTTHGLLTWQLDVPSWKYSSDDEVRRLRERLFEMLSADSRVEGVASITALPLLQFDATSAFDIDGRATPGQDDKPFAAVSVASHGFFEVARIAVLRGRSFDATDYAATESVVVVSREAARRYWGTAGSDPIGAYVRVVAEGPRSGWHGRVVGIVDDTANPDVERGPVPHMYFLDAQRPQREYSVVLRAGDPAALADEVRRAVYTADPELAIYRLRTVDAAIADEQSTSTIIMGLFVSFAAVALLLAASGLYGVMAFSVSRRAPEIAVRMALGASESDIGRHVLGEGLRLTAVGIAFGLLGALGLANAMASMLFGVTPRDPSTYAGVVLVTLLAIVPAIWIPARRAIKVDPIQNLKQA